jgi:hypothetical protein
MAQCSSNIVEAFQHYRHHQHRQRRTHHLFVPSSSYAQASVPLSLQQQQHLKMSGGRQAISSLCAVNSNEDENHKVGDSDSDTNENDNYIDNELPLPLPSLSTDKQLSHNSNSGSSSRSKVESKEDMVSLPSLKSVISSVANLFLDLWSAIIMFLGVCFTFGIVLNIMGYGYRFSSTEFLHIDTLDNIRTERQFEIIEQRYERQERRKQTLIETTSPTTSSLSNSNN